MKTRKAYILYDYTDAEADLRNLGVYSTINLAKKAAQTSFDKAPSDYRFFYIESSAIDQKVPQRSEIIKETCIDPKGNLIWIDTFNYDD